MSNIVNDNFPSRWQLIWSEEFNTPYLNQEKFSYSLGNWLINEKGEYMIEGWGNQELQYYTNHHENLFIKDSKLIIQAVKKLSPQQFKKYYKYTSARVHTKGKFSFQYGRIDIKAKMPLGNGLWPAIWLLPEDNVYGEWPLSGEIDIVESKGRISNQVFGTLHYGDLYPDNHHTQGTYVFDINTSINDFHTYSCIWTKDSISWLVDGHIYQTQTKWHSGALDKPHPYPAPFNQRFYLVLNLAVGGLFDNVKVDDTKLPAKLEIDYIRVYQ